MAENETRKWPRYLLALAIGLASGALAAWIGLPLPWFLGPMIGNTIASMLSAPILGPRVLRPIAVPILGVMLGSAFLPELFAQAAGWTATLVMVPVFIALSVILNMAYFRRIGRFDPVTAYFASMPGGLNEMLVLGEAAGADIRKVALAHASRILLVVILVGLLYGYVLGADIDRGRVPFTAFGDLTLADAGWLLSCAAIGVPLGRYLRLPAGLMVGPMLVSAVAHLSGVVGIGPPTLLSLAAQFVLGTNVGCRFSGLPARIILTNLTLGLGAAVLMLLVALFCALIVSLASDIGPTAAFLAFAPGGMMEMSLLALAIGESIAYISITHVFRFVVVLFQAPIVFRLIRPRNRHLPDCAGPPANPNKDE